MKLVESALIILACLAFAACSSTPTTTGTREGTPGGAGVDAGAGTGMRPIPKSAAAKSADDSPGITTLSSNGRDLKQCGRNLRTGSRIPRNVCQPTGFNGMYPSAGMNMGTARESQPGYGNTNH